MSAGDRHEGEHLEKTGPGHLACTNFDSRLPETLGGSCGDRTMPTSYIT